MITLALATMLAFNLPSYHLVFEKSGMTGVNIEDMTQSECEKHAKTFKKTAKAHCVLTIGQRELT